MRALRCLLPLGLPLLASGTAAAAELTALETRWLQAGWPVIAYAQRQNMPLDIIVQPQSKPGDAPLAMGFVGQRCKLVLSMRGNPDAEATLASIEPGLLPAVVESMVAHELGHCRRYVQGVWHTLPAGFMEASGDGEEGAESATASAPAGAVQDVELVRLRRDMRETRREEGYADLVGLAWTRLRHPAQYRQVHAWYTQVRADQPVPGAHHDTRAWLRLAADPQAFGTQGDLFEQAWPLWQRGLVLED